MEISKLGVVGAGQMTLAHLVGVAAVAQQRVTVDVNLALLRRGLRDALLLDLRRWQRRSVLNQAWRNAQLRRAWHRGEAVEQLALRYNR